MEDKKQAKWFEKLPPVDTRNVQASASNTKRSKQFDDRIYFDTYINETYTWVESVANQLGVWERKDIAWKVLREVMHIIRDRITLQEVFHLSAQLPVFIRGMYFEGYSISGKPKKFHVSEIEKRLKKVLRGTPKITPQDAFGAVILTLHSYISEGELDDIYDTLPGDIKDYWEESLKIEML